MNCNRCNNDDKRYFYYFNNQFVCRKCLMFKETFVNKKVLSYQENVDSEYFLPFKLSVQQKKLSKQLLTNIKNNLSTLVYAACGAGKTEIILESIKYCLDNNLKVAISIPRRQVVIELSERLSSYFKNLKVVKVCEGFTKDVYGDLIICTTHQLYRYQNYFDLLIIDEPDAFPFYNNELLINIAKGSVKNITVYLSATPSEEMKLLPTVKLFKRFHGYDLLVPKVYINFKFMLFIKLVKFIKNHQKVLLFVPSVNLAKKMSKLLNYPYIHSNSDNKEKLIVDFDNEKFKVLITTTILERGITIEKVNICVLYAEHITFSKASLIQIAGRVGRSVEYPNGSGLFLLNKKSRKVDLCIKELEMMNA